MVTDPSTCKPDEAYYVELDNGRHGIGVRNARMTVQPWIVIGGPGEKWATETYRDADVDELTRLVPGRPVTRDDLPDAVDLTKLVGECVYDSFWGPILDAVVGHLNAQGGLPAARPRPTEEVAYQLRSAETQRDYWQRKFESMRDEHNRQAQAWGEKRDAYEATIAELEGEKNAAMATRDAQVSFTSRALDAQANAEARAEAAEARIRELEADDDPVVYVMRESDIAARKVTHDGMGTFIPEDGGWYGDDAHECRQEVRKALDEAAWAEAVARAMEEADPDMRARYLAGMDAADWEALPESVRQAWRQEAAK